MELKTTVDLTPQDLALIDARRGVDMWRIVRYFPSDCIS